MWRKWFELCVLTLLLGALGCAAGAPPSLVRPDPPAIAWDPTFDPGPFRVTFAGADDAQLTLAFSRPVAGAASNAAPAWVRQQGTRTALGGSFQWFGERIAVFTPSPAFQLATNYEVAFDPELSSRDRARLGPVPHFLFATGAPEVLSARYTYDGTVDSHPLASLEFDRVVSANFLRPRLRVEGTRGRNIETVPFEIVLPEGSELDERSSFDLALDRKVTALREVTLVVSLEGAASNEARMTLKEAGPLFASIRCTAPGKSEESESPELCSLADGAVWLALSKPVSERVLVRHLVGAHSLPLVQGVDETSTDTFELDRRFQLEPGKTYRIRLKAGIKTLDGETTTRDQLLTFTTADTAKSLAFRNLDARGNVVEAARAEIGLGVDTTNVPAFELWQAPLSDAALLELLAEPGSIAKVAGLPRAVSRTIAVRAPKNTSVLNKFLLSPALRPRFGRGLFALAAVAAPMPAEVRILSVTDLALTAKWSPHGGLVWVTHLSSGKPEESARVTLYQGQRSVFSAITDARGIASIPESVSAACAGAAEPLTAIVRTDADVAYTELDGLAPRGSLALGQAFTDRKLYRPGESVFVKGYFREPTGRGLMTPRGERVELALHDDQGRNLATHTVKADDFGAFSSEFRLPQEMRLGAGSIAARLILGEPPRAAFAPHSKKRTRGHALADELVSWFRVSEYRVVDMKVTLRADQRSYTRGQTATLESDAEYLFGAKLHDVPLSIEMSRSRSSFTPAGLENFATDSSELWRDHVEPSPNVAAPNPDVVVRTRVGAGGVNSSSVSLSLPGQTTPERVTFDVSVNDASRAFVASDSVTVLVHPAELYLGLRIAHADELRAGDAIRPEVLVVSPDGTPRTDVPVRLELLHFEGDSVRQTGPNCSSSSASRPSACALALARSGTFYVRASAVDARGNALSAVRTLLVGEKATRQPEPAPLPTNEVALEKPSIARERAFAERCLARRAQDDPLLLEQDSDARQEVGDTLWVCAHGPSPFLVTLEREGVLHYDLLEHQGPLMWKYPITANLHPGFSISLHGQRPRDAAFTKALSEAVDRGRPQPFRSEREIFVNLPARRQLSIALATAATQAPGTQTNIGVRVRDGDGNPVRAQVTLWAVDEGAFLLQPFALPDPNRVFADDRPSDVRTSVSESSLYTGFSRTHLTRSPKVRMGGTQVGTSHPFTRSQFRSTAWFLPNVLTEPDGSANVKALLPDNLTKWKLFAVAASAGDAFGSAETSFVTQRPLVAHPILPRFLRAGDRFEATLAIDTLLAHPVELEVSLESDGALSGVGHERIHVAAKGNALLHFPVSARAAGEGKLTFRVEGPAGLSDSISQTKRVQAPVLLEAKVWSGSSGARGEQPLGDLSALRSDVGELTYHVATSPLVGLSEGFEALIEYPYGCSEQLASRLLPLLRLRALATSVGVQLPSDVDAQIRSGLVRLLSHQREDGGFGFWPGSSASDAWLSAWVVFALESASERGFSVPHEAREQALGYLGSVRPPNASARALVENVLSLVGRPREAALRELALNGKLSRFGRALLAHALVEVDPALAARLSDALLAEADVTAASAALHSNATSSGWLAESDTETSAAALRAVLATKPSHPLVPKLIRGLLSQRRAGHWGSTQANAWALFALDDARRKLVESSPSGAALSLSLAGRPLATSPGGTPLAGVIPMADLLGQRALEFGVERGTLYYEAVLRFARRTAPNVTVEHGIHVSRQLTALAPDGGRRPPGAIHVGDHVQVDVFLMSPTPRQQVVLDDPIPAGFDAQDNGRIDAALDVSHRELRDDRVLSFFDELPAGVTHTSYRLRAISPGEFALPPAKAECMYQPDVYGVSPRETTRVTR